MTNINKITHIGLIILFVFTLLSCSKTGGEELVGEWVAVENPSADNYIVIKKSGNIYTCEFKSHGQPQKFPAIYKEGILKIQAGGYEHPAFYDKETGYMIISDKTGTAKFKRK